MVYTDRALNHMSQRFQGVMRDISRILKAVHNARSAIVVPGSGTFGMEAVARQFATDKKCLIIRNGWFSSAGRKFSTVAGFPLQHKYSRHAASAPMPKRHLLAVAGRGN